MWWCTYGADGTHGVVDASWTHASLHHLESTALSENDVLGWDTHVFEYQVGVAMGSVVVAVYTEHPLDGDACGIGRDNNDRLLLILVRVIRIGFAQDNVDLASGVSSTGYPPFLYMLSDKFNTKVGIHYLSIQHIRVPIPLHT